MYYTPTLIVPGKTAHIEYERALAMAIRDGTYVIDDDNVVIFDSPWEVIDKSWLRN